jgi:tripartite-type tricarboxylate transporter receptor subunit TctC
MPLLRRCLSALALVAGLWVTLGVHAQTWPAKPVTIVMGFPAGSGVDVVARILQEPLEKELGATLVLDYRAGAGGNVASEFVAKARPDGYTLLLGTSATHGVNAALYKRLPFDVEADFTPIAPLVDVSNVLTVNPAVIDAASIQDFITQVKAAPGRYNFALTGNGTSTHLAFAEFNARPGSTWSMCPIRVARKPCRPWSRARPAAFSTRSRPCSARRGPAASVFSASRR